jgi:hypothetical protein
MNTYCEFQDTNTLFNDKKIYVCKYCGIKLVLEDPSVEILCFKKMVDVKRSISENSGVPFPTSIIDTTPDKMEEVVKEYIRNKHSKSESNDTLCTDEQIQERLNICTSCPHYKDNMCELCGCTIVRENNYMNKLAHKLSSCPDNRWGPIS